MQNLILQWQRVFADDFDQSDIFFFPIESWENAICHLYFIYLVPRVERKTGEEQQPLCSIHVVAISCKGKFSLGSNRDIFST